MNPKQEEFLESSKGFLMAVLHNLSKMIRHFDLENGQIRQKTLF